MMILKRYYKISDLVRIPNLKQENWGQWCIEDASVYAPDGCCLRAHHLHCTFDKDGKPEGIMVRLEYYEVNV